jgi:phosphoribosylformylglycinamidine synthase I
MKFGVIVFPGSNCDYDAYMAIKTVIGHDAEFLWHQDSSLNRCDCLILPGGFAYGDYLRTGAIARFSTIMKKVIEFANNGGLVIGICNGFQILLESGLLPGAMLKNSSLRFICRFVHIRAENRNFQQPMPRREGFKDSHSALRRELLHPPGRFEKTQGKRSDSVPVLR